MLKQSRKENRPETVSLPDEIQTPYTMSNDPDIQDVHLEFIRGQEDDVDGRLTFGIPVLGTAPGNQIPGQDNWIWNLCECIKLFSQGTFQSTFVKGQHDTYRFFRKPINEFLRK